MSKFISIEGLPSKAKRRIFQTLDNREDITVVHEVDYGILPLIASIKNNQIDIETEVLRHAATTRSGIVNDIDPALRKGETVVSFGFLARLYAFLFFTVYDEFFDRKRLTNQFFDLHNTWCAHLYPDISIFVPTDIKSSSYFLMEDNLPGSRVVGSNLIADSDDLRHLQDILQQALKGYTSFGDRCRRYDPSALRRYYRKKEGGHVWGELDTVAEVERKSAEYQEVGDAEIVNPNHLYEEREPIDIDPLYTMGRTWWCPLSPGPSHELEEQVLRIIGVDDDA